MQYDLYFIWMSMMYFNDKIGVEGKKQVLIMVLVYLHSYKCHVHQRDLNPSKYKTSQRLLQGSGEREENVTFIPLIFVWKEYQHEDASCAPVPL